MTLNAVNFGCMPNYGYENGKARSSSEYAKGVVYDMEIKASEQKIADLHDRLSAKDTTDSQKVILEAMLKNEENKIQKLRAKALDFDTFDKVGFAPENKDMRPVFLKKVLPLVGCDLPEQGGISGNLDKKMANLPSVFYLA